MDRINFASKKHSRSYESKGLPQNFPETFTGSPSLAHWMLYDEPAEGQHIEKMPVKRAKVFSGVC